MKWTFCNFQSRARLLSIAGRSFWMTDLPQLVEGFTLPAKIRHKRLSCCCAVTIQLDSVMTDWLNRSISAAEKSHGLPQLSDHLSVFNLELWMKSSAPGTRSHEARRPRSANPKTWLVLCLFLYVFRPEWSSRTLSTRLSGSTDSPFPCAYYPA